MAQNLAQMGIKGTEDWYIGQIKREQANEILLKGTVGMFAVRGSSEPGNFALSVRDRQRVNHYKIIAARRQTQEGFKFKIGQQEFISIHHIVEFYKKNKLGDSALTVPAPRLVYRAKTDYKPDPSDENSSEHLSLRQNESVIFLDVMIGPSGAENPAMWRVLKRNTGDVGYVPSACLRHSSPDETDNCKFGVLRQLQASMPFDVEVMRARNPNIFDPNQMQLEVGDFIRVKQVFHDQPELWRGYNHRSKLEGIFPFNYVRPVMSGSAGETCRFSGMSNNSIASSKGGGSGGSGNRCSQMSGCALDEHCEEMAA